MTETTQQQDTFAKYGKTFQEKIILALVTDHTWAAQVQDVLDSSYFEYKSFQFVVEQYYKHFSKYKDFPSLDLLGTITKNELNNNTDAILRDQALDALKKVKTAADICDLPYVKEKTLDFCKRQSVKKALEETINLVQTEKYETILERLKKAINSGTTQTSGMDLVSDIDTRYTENPRNCIPTGIPNLDDRKILNGGLGKGELGIVIAPSGCHAKGTKILMHDGTVKKVEDIEVGQRLMGPDNRPRTVLKLVSGNNMMYRVTPIKGEPFEVNGEHVLSLRNCVDASITNISINDYLKKSNNFRNTHKLYRTDALHFDDKEQKLLLDPYMLGVLLGDGCFSSNRVELKRLGLWSTRSDSKYVPAPYKTATIKSRLELLAGIFDTDGSLSSNSYDFVSKSQRLAEDVVFLCRSVGLAAYMKECQTGVVGTYYRVCVSGNTDKIPCRIPRKQASKRQQIKNALNVGFVVEPIETGNYYGFSIDQDHLYVMGDFTVTHNCGKSHILVHIGAQALLRGKNILHYTFELNEKSIGIRYDSHLGGVDVLDLTERDSQTNQPKMLDYIKGWYRDNLEQLGKLRIKKFPGHQITANGLRAHIEKLSLQNFWPDILIVDYADLVRSTEKLDNPRLEFALVYDELRSLSDELGIPVWSASQSNKDGVYADIVNDTNMAEAYAKANPCDFIMGFGRKPEQKSTGYGTLFISKNRFGLDGIKLNVHLNTAQSRLRIVQESEMPTSNGESHITEKEMTSIKKTWRDVQKGTKNTKLTVEKVK